MRVEHIVILDDFLQPEACHDQPGSDGYAQMVNCFTCAKTHYAAFSFKVLRTGEDSASKDLAARYFSLAGLVPGLDAWPQAYYEKPNPGQLALLAALCEDSLALGWQLPDCVIHGFCVLRIPYVDFAFHPVGFMPRRPIAVRSNISALYGFFKSMRMDEDEMKKAAAALSSGLDSAGVAEGIHAGGNKALFVCQPENDRSLMQRGKFARLEEYAQEIKNILASHDALLVKKCDRAGSKSHLWLTQLFPGVQMTDADTYTLMRLKNVSAVYSLAADASLEARYFGKKGIQIIPDIRDFYSSYMDAIHYMPIKNELDAQTFWHHILSVCQIRS